MYIYAGAKCIDARAFKVLSEYIKEKKEIKVDKKIYYIITNEDIEHIAEKTNNPKLVPRKLIFLENKLEFDINYNKYNMFKNSEKKQNLKDFEYSYDNNNLSVSKNEYSDTNHLDYEKYDEEFNNSINNLKF